MVNSLERGALFTWCVGIVGGRGGVLIVVVVVVVAVCSSSL